MTPPLKFCPTHEEHTKQAKMAEVHCATCSREKKTIQHLFAITQTLAAGLCK
jgi:hypothetical protein